MQLELDAINGTLGDAIMQGGSVYTTASSLAFQWKVAGPAQSSSTHSSLLITRELTDLFSARRGLFVFLFSFTR